jgi:hypothetical protein
MVRARNSEGASDFTDPKCPLLPPAKREPLEAVGLPAPPAPRVVLSWTNPDYGDPPTMLKIRRSLDPRGPFYNYDEIPYVSAANGFYEDTGVITGQQYCYQIFATNGASIASQSLPSQACTAAPQPLTIYNFRSKVRPHSVTFTWDTNVATKGEVSLNGGSLLRIPGVGTHHTITFRPLTDQTAYSFDVAATRIAEPHDSVHELGSFTTPDPSTFMYISNVSLSTAATSATITWVTSTRADGTVEYGTENAGTCTYTNTLPSGTNVLTHTTTISGLVPEDRYCYRLTATRGSDTDEYTSSFETVGMPQLRIQSVSGPFLRKNESGPDVDTKPWYMEYKVQIKNHRGRTALSANQVAVVTDATTLDVPCDQLREISGTWAGCYSPVESVALSLSSSPPVDIPPDGSSEVSLIFPVRVPLRGLIGSEANLHLSLGYQYASGSGTVSATSNFTTTVPLKRFGLSITMSDSPDPVSQHSLFLVYRIKITNGGICDYDDEPCVSPPFSAILSWEQWGAPASLYSVKFQPISPSCNGHPAAPSYFLSCELPGIPGGTVATGRLIFKPVWWLQPEDRQLITKGYLSQPWQDPYPFDDVVSEFTTIGSGGSTPHEVDVTGWVLGEMSYINPVSCVDSGQQVQGAHAYYRYCNYGGSSYSYLHGDPVVMPEGSMVYGSASFPFNAGYDDGVLEPGECVEMLYYVCPLSDLSLMRQARFHIHGYILP